APDPTHRMTNSTDVAASAAEALTSADIERASAFAREPVLINGEDPDDLAPGTARYRAVRSALEEVTAGRESPSPEWRREYALVLGLERLLAEDPPQLADGARLDEHQVDALSGTLAALISDVEERGLDGTYNGEPESPPSSTELAGDGAGSAEASN